MADNHTFSEKRPTVETRNALSICVNNFLNERNWLPARLAREAELDKATICRITRYRRCDEKTYTPKISAICAVALALRLNEDETHALFASVFPWWNIFWEAIREGKGLQETNERLYDAGIPTITSLD